MTLTIKGLDDLIERLQETRKSLDTKCRTFVQRLVDYGYEIASVGFQTAQYDGTNDVQVNIEWSKNNREATLVASGKSVLFIEFGSGTQTYKEEHPLAGQFGYVRGGYGQGKGKQEKWAYIGDAGTNGLRVSTAKSGGGVIITKGNPANRVMYNTGKDMQNQVERIAREVFR